MSEPRVEELERCECPQDLVDADGACRKFEACRCPTHDGEGLQSHCRECGHAPRCHGR